MTAIEPWAWIGVGYGTALLLVAYLIDLMAKRAHTRMQEDVLRFEWKRYLGWPGQAPSYKVGERIWLQARDEAKQRQGRDFDLKTFHRDALNLGSLGLDPLRKALSRI